MKQPAPPADVLAVFAQYGVNKTSMEDIAHAAGLSRQSIYNRFGSKEAVLDWAIRGVLENSAGRAIGLLEGDRAEPIPALLGAFRAWTGEHVALLRNTPHGAELLAHATESVGKPTNEHEQAFNESLERFFIDAGFARSVADAGELVFVLNMASKGLLLKSSTTEQYMEGFERLVRVLLNDTPE